MAAVTQGDGAGQEGFPAPRPDLWAQIEAWPMPQVRDLLIGGQGFPQALHQRGGWSDQDTARVIREYRRFVYLKALTGEALTPPEAVDRAWHLHMQQATDWAAFQAELGVRITHQPGLTWPANQASYRRCLTLYQVLWPDPPPSDIWPSPDQMLRAARLRRGAMLSAGGGAILLVLAALLPGGWGGVASFVGLLLIFAGGLALFLSQAAPAQIANCA